MRVGVGLVQTDVTVFDSKGAFVDDLKSDQFELTVDGKRQQVAFCELVSSGFAGDNSSKPASNASRTPAREPAAASDMGRTLFFFVDDWHISTESLVRARDALSRLVDTEVGPADRVAIFSATGTPGFLQQLSDNKAVLRAAIARLTLSNPPVQDQAQPPMTESQALAIEHNDSAVIGYFVDATLSIMAARTSRAMVERLVRSRAADLAIASAEIAQRTLSSLSHFLRVLAAMPGRKVFFYLSDGFVMQPQRSDVLAQIRQVTDAAARAGVVIYSLDTRGLIVGSPDASAPGRPDPSGRMARNAMNQVIAPQDALNALAADTGGDFLANTNALDAAVAVTLRETSRYYLLGWYLESGMQEPGKYRSIQVKVKGRSDLKIRLRRGKVDLTQLVPQTRILALPAKGAETSSPEVLAQAIRSPFPIGDLPVALFAACDFSREQGYGLSISVQTGLETAEGVADKEGSVDMLGMISGIDGVTMSSFSESLPLPQDASDRRLPGTKEWRYSGVMRVEPGIYQVRVAVRDTRTGRSGTALQWVEVPQFEPGDVIVTGLFLEQLNEGGAGNADPVRDPLSGGHYSIDRHFSRNASVQYYQHIYNGGRLPLTAQAKVFRGNQLVHQSAQVVPSQSAPADGALLLYHGALPPDILVPGAYTLEVTVTNKASSASIIRSVHFWIQ